jgi:hypothetical protein
MNELIKRLILQTDFDLDLNQGNFIGYEGRWLNQDLVSLVHLVVADCTNEIAKLGLENQEEPVIPWFTDTIISNINNRYGISSGK